MVFIGSSSQRIRSKRGRTRSGTSIALVALGLVLICVFLPLLMARFISTQDSNDTLSAANVLKRASAVKGALKLQTEPKFLDTVKSCIPKEDKKCLQHIPEGVEKQRVGILAPPGRIADAFAEWVREGIDRYQLDFPLSVELVPTSHVPPYGYGKSHGWTKIVRLVTLPLALGAIDSASYLGRSESGAKEGSDTSEWHSPESGEITSSLREVVRWHCRLSHVSAHTAMMTVALPDVIKKPVNTTEALIQFIGARPDKPLTQEPWQIRTTMAGNHADPGKVENAVDSLADRVGSLFDGGQVNAKSLQEQMNTALASELSTTNDLGDWPCKSFWDIGGGAKNEGSGEQMTNAVKRIAEALAPNCAAPHTHCSVNKDSCEERGDVKCK